MAGEASTGQSTTAGMFLPEGLSQISGTMMVMGSPVRVAAYRVAMANSFGTPSERNTAVRPDRSPLPTWRSSSHSTPDEYQAAMARTCSGCSFSPTRSKRPAITNEIPPSAWPPPTADSFVELQIR